MPVQFNKFPALVTTSDGTVVDRAAVIVQDGSARLAVQQRNDTFDGGRVAVIATLENVTDVQAGRHATITAADGQTWTVEEGSGCGCKSPLQAWYGAQLRGQPIGT